VQSEILEQLRQAFTTPGALETLADRLGTDRRGVQRALTFGVPVALGGLHAAVTKDPAPWTAATASLGEPESLGSVVAGGPTPTGRTLVEQAFGSRLDAVTASLAGTAGIPPAVAGDTLATMVPLALLASRPETGELTQDALVSRLGAAAEESAASVPGGAAAVAAVLTAAPTATATAAAPPTDTEPAPEPVGATSSRPNWPLWIGVGVLAAILVVGGIWLATRGGDDGSAATTAAPSSTTASDGTITIASTTAPSNETTAAGTTEAASTTEAPTTAAPVTVPAAVQQMNDLAKGTLVFEPSSTTLSADAGPALDQIATILKDNPDLDVFVDGHTDNLGKADENQQLSELRANVVVAELTARGVARERLTPRGFGGDRPIADNGTPEGQAANRRIEFTYRP